MKAFINLFDRLYREVELQKGETLCDKIRVEYFEDSKVPENRCIFCVDRDYYENYYNVYQDNGKYTVTQQHRAAQYPCFENKSVEYAAVILFILLSRYEIDLWGSDNARRFSEEYENENNSTMRKILKERFGYLLSFGENVYDKISICVSAEKYTQAYYHKKFYHEIYGIDEKAKERRKYNIAYNACARIEVFRELLPKIKKVVPLENKSENSKLEFLFVSGENEDTATD